MDLGVYGLHTLTGLLGPAKSVTCLSGISVPHRVVRTGPYKGKDIEVEMDDNTIIMLDFGTPPTPSWTPPTASGLARGR